MVIDLEQVRLPLAESNAVNLIDVSLYYNVR